MYIHAKTVGWLARRGALEGGLTLRKSLYTGGFALAHAFMCSSVSIARWLDRFLYPEFELTKVTPPVFVIATPRSGTTFLHHLLALDDQQFVSFKLYQTLAPSVLLERAIGALRALDGQAGLGLSRALDAIDRRMFTAWNGIHRVGLRADEEDENLFVYSLVSPALYMLFPAIQAIPELIDLGGFTQKSLRRLAHDYRETVRRLLFVTGGQRTPLIKNVLLPSRLPVAKLAFPNARYVHVVRDPREAIPSAVSLFYAMWQTHSPKIAANSPATRALAEMFLRHYRLLCDEGQKQPAESWVTVRFESLVSDPVATVSRIYEALGLTITPRFRERLEQAAADGRRFKSRHTYDLARFGLTESDLRAALGPHWEQVTSSDAASTTLALD
ncbi:MAG TPA: sulfotransferase [Polyangiaceae bacterium]|jgi:LPS sulfotransferase NodH